MTTIITTDSSVKRTSVGIKSKYLAQMEKIVPTRKRTEFINRAIKHELELEKENHERRIALKSLETLRKTRESLPKSQISSEEIVRELRDHE